MHLLNYRHPMTPDMLREMRRHYEITLARLDGEMVPLARTRSRLAQQLEAAGERGFDVQLSRLDLDIAALQKRRQDHQDTIDEIDRRIAATAPAAV